MNNNFQPLKNKEEFFEGFKSPKEYIAFGKYEDRDFNMNDYNSNLLILRKPLEEKIMNNIIHYFEDQTEMDNSFSLIAKTESDTHIMLITLTELNDNSLHHLVHLKNVIQLLDDATSTNDCLRALQYLQELRQDKYVEEKESLQIEELIKSQLSNNGWKNIEEFAPELLNTNLSKNKRKM